MKKKGKASYTLSSLIQEDTASQHAVDVPMKHDSAHVHHHHQQHHPVASDRGQPALEPTNNIEDHHVETASGGS